MNATCVTRAMVLLVMLRLFLQLSGVISDSRLDTDGTTGRWDVAICEPAVENAGAVAGDAIVSDTRALSTSEHVQFSRLEAPWQHLPFEPHLYCDDKEEMTDRHRKTIDNRPQTADRHVDGPSMLTSNPSSHPAQPSVWQIPPMSLTFGEQAEWLILCTPPTLIRWIVDLGPPAAVHVQAPTADVPWMDLHYRTSDTEPLHNVRMHPMTLDGQPGWFASSVTPPALTSISLTRYHLAYYLTWYTTRTGVTCDSPWYTTELPVYADDRCRSEPQIEWRLHDGRVQVRAHTIIDGVDGIRWTFLRYRGIEKYFTTLFPWGELRLPHDQSWLSTNDLWVGFDRNVTYYLEWVIVDGSMCESQPRTVDLPLLPPLDKDCDERSLVIEWRLHQGSHLQAHFQVRSTPISTARWLDVYYQPIDSRDSVAYVHPYHILRMMGWMWTDAQYMNPRDHRQVRAFARWALVDGRECTSSRHTFSIFNVI